MKQATVTRIGGSTIPARLRALADELDRDGIDMRAIGVAVIARVDIEGVGVDVVPLGGCDVLRTLGVLSLAKDQVLKRDGE